MFGTRTDPAQKTSTTKWDRVLRDPVRKLRCTRHCIVLLKFDKIWKALSSYLVRTNDNPDRVMRFGAIQEGKKVAA